MGFLGFNRDTVNFDIHVFGKSMFFNTSARRQVFESFRIHFIHRSKIVSFQKMVVRTTLKPQPAASSAPCRFSITFSVCT